MQDQLSTRLTIRDVRADDVAQLVELINALNAHEGTAQSMTQQHAEFMLFHPARPVRMHCRVAVLGARVIGFVLFYDGYDTASTSMGFHIADIFIEPDFRRQRVGEQLMRDVAALCLAQGGEWCSLTALSRNVAAIGFYDTLGFASPKVTFRSIGPQGLASLVNRTN